MRVLRKLTSYFEWDRSPEPLVVPDYGQLSPEVLAILYEEVHATLIRYVDFSWEELQQPRPLFVAFQDRALSVEASHEVFLKHYGNYVGVVKELERCRIQPKPLSRKVCSVIETLTASASPKECGVLLSTKP